MISPFIVGVSGHRDLDAADVPRLREVVATFVRELKGHLPRTDLRIIVGMAEGADLLVAETALALGVEVDAVLPMPFEHYAADFGPEGLAKLTELLAHPKVRRTELSAPAHDDPGGGPHHPTERELLYANLTQTLIQRSSLLLALWDGETSERPGGTADTVLRYLGVRTDDIACVDSLEFVTATPAEMLDTRLVYWAPTPREGTNSPAAGRAPCYLAGLGDNVLQVHESMPPALASQLVLLDRYNDNFRELRDAGRVARLDSLLATLPTGTPLYNRAALEEIDAQYGKADALAVYYQHHSDRLFHLFGIMAFAMGFAYLVYEKLFESRLIVLLYLVILVGSVALYQRLQKHQWFAKHLVCRAIAETLRVKFYLRLAGADHLVDAESVLSLSGIDAFRGFSWVRHVLKGVGIIDRRAAAVRAHEALHEGQVERSWIEAQHRYFTRRVAKLERDSRRVALVKRTVFAVILAVITILVAFGAEVSQTNVVNGVSVKNWLTFGVGVLAILLGVLELHQNKMATRELLWQYRNQLRHFSRARLELARTLAPGRRRDVLAELGKDSLMESYLWTIHRYHREHEPPTAR